MGPVRFEGATVCLGSLAGGVDDDGADVGRWAVIAADVAADDDADDFDGVV